MKNFIDIVTLESYPNAMSVDVENIANYYKQEDKCKIGNDIFSTYSCIDLKVPAGGRFETLHCLLPYTVLNSYIIKCQSKYLTRSEAKWYFYFFLISFPFINSLVKIILDLIWR